MSRGKKIKTFVLLSVIKNKQINKWIIKQINGKQYFKHTKTTTV